MKLPADKIAKYILHDSSNKFFSLKNMKLVDEVTELLKNMLQGLIIKHQNTKGISNSMATIGY